MGGCSAHRCGSGAGAGRSSFPGLEQGDSSTVAAPKGFG